MSCASRSSCRFRAPRKPYRAFRKRARAGGPFSFLVLVHPALYFAAEYPVDIDRVSEDERQHEEPAAADEAQRTFVGRCVPDRQPVEQHVRENAVSQAD